MNYNEVFKSLLVHYFMAGRAEFLENVLLYFHLGEHMKYKEAKKIQWQAEVWLDSFLMQSAVMWLAGQGYVKHEVPDEIHGYQVRTSIPYRADALAMPLYCWIIRAGYNTVKNGYCFTQDIYVKHPFQVKWIFGSLEPNECQIS